MALRNGAYDYLVKPFDDIEMFNYSWFGDIVGQGLDSICAVDRRTGELLDQGEVYA